MTRFARAPPTLNDWTPSVGGKSRAPSSELIGPRLRAHGHACEPAGRETPAPERLAESTPVLEERVPASQRRSRGLRVTGRCRARRRALGLPLFTRYVE